MGIFPASDRYALRVSPAKPVSLVPDRATVPVSAGYTRPCSPVIRFLSPNSARSFFRATTTGQSGAHGRECRSGVDPLKIIPVRRRYRVRRIAATVIIAAVVSGCLHVGSGLPPTLRRLPLEKDTAARRSYHTVGRGENLADIARAYGVDAQHLAEVNNLQEPFNLEEKRRLFVPEKSRAKEGNASQKTKAKESEDQEAPGKLSWPVEGKVISEFGVRRGIQHNGMLIEAPEDAPVRAAADGKVGFVDDMAGYGKIVIIEHPNRLLTVYAHLKETKAAAGQRVDRGKIIGTVGSSGRVQRPALHFEVRARSKARNPRVFLPDAP